MELLSAMGALFGLAIGWLAHEQYLRWRAEKKTPKPRPEFSPANPEHHYHADLANNGKREEEAASLFDNVTRQLNDENR